MESLAKAIMQKLEKTLEGLGNSSDIYFKLPIKTICGIKVSSELKFVRHNSQIHAVAFNVESYDICDESEDSPSIFYRNVLKDLRVTTLTLEQIISCIEQILTIIPTLKFNKKTSELTDEDFLGDDVHELFKFDNTTIIGDVCSVCHELTNTRTDCSHQLCLVCMSSIKGYYESGEHIRKCPLCRDDITILHH